MAFVSRINGNVAPESPLQRLLDTQPLLVHRETLWKVLAERCRGPQVKLGAPRKTGEVSHGGDHVEGVTVSESGDSPGVFGVSYPEFPDSYRSPAAH